MKYIFCALMAAGMAFAQAPSVKTGGVVNAASYGLAGLPGGAIAPGSMIVIFGSNMGPATLQQATSFPLPTSMGGTSLKVTVGSTTVTPILIYTSAAQIAAILPSSTPVGAATMVVTYNGNAGAGVSFQVAASNFGIFSSNSAGNGPGIIADANSKIFASLSAANVGQTVVIWGTGLGAVAGDEAGGPLPGDQPAIPVEVYVGNVKATVSYRGRSGCCGGVDQISFAVPNVTGCRVPVQVKINNSVSNSITMPITAAGTSACSDPGGPTPAELQRYISKGSVSIGGISLVRFSSSAAIPGFGNFSVTADVGAATFAKYPASVLDTAGNPFNAVTSGSCIITQFRGSTGIAADPVLPTWLDAGTSLTVTGSGLTKLLNKTVLGTSTSYTGELGNIQSLPGVPLTAGMLDPGTVTVSGAGGADVKAFTASINVATPLLWTNQDATTTINRANGLTVNWTGGDQTGFVYIAGSSLASVASDSPGAQFICYVNPALKTFTIPQTVLLALPVSATISGISTGQLAVGSFSAGKPFTAVGLDYAYLLTLINSQKSLNYQ